MIDLLKNGRRRQKFLSARCCKIITKYLLSCFLIYFGITRCPSPTGELHIAASGWLFGFFLPRTKAEISARIEDTDRERFVNGSMEHIIAWIGLV